MPTMAGDKHGHLKLSRKIFLPLDEGGSKAWNKRRVFSEFEAWVYFIHAASWKERSWELRSGAIVQLKRGETPPLAVRWLMKAWRWRSESSVHRVLREFLTEGQISEQQKTTDGNTYSLVNYELYQTTQNAPKAEKRTAPERHKNSARTTSEQLENETEASISSVRDTTSNTLSWSKRAVQFWIDRFGHCAIAGRIGKALLPLIGKYGEDAVLKAWEGYLTSKQPEFATPEDFANRYTHWATAKPQLELTNVRNNAGATGQSQQHADVQATGTDGRRSAFVIERG